MKNETSLDAARAFLDRLAARLGNEKFELVGFLTELAELDAKKLALELGYPSTFACLVNKLGLPESSACRRLGAARLLARFPAIRGYLLRSRINLMGLIALRDVLDETNVDELLERAAGLSEPEVRELTKRVRTERAALTVELPLATPPAATVDVEVADRVAPVQPIDDVRPVTLWMGSELREELAAVRALASHAVPSGRQEDVLLYVLRAQRKILERRRYGAKRRTATPNPATRTAATRTADTATPNPATRTADTATPNPATRTADTATPNPATRTADTATPNPATPYPATANPATPASAPPNPATSNPATANPATPASAPPNPATSNPATRTADTATSNPATRTADTATPNPATRTADTATPYPATPASAPPNPATSNPATRTTDTATPNPATRIADTATPNPATRTADTATPNPATPAPPNAATPASDAAAAPTVQPPRKAHIPAPVRREVYDREGGTCAFVADDRRCGSKWQIEYQHIIPIARGGDSTASNLTIFCRPHNMLQAERDFGVDHVAAKRAARPKQATKLDSSPHAADVVSALSNLGYSRREARHGVEIALVRVAPDSGFTTLLREALSTLRRPPEWKRQTGDGVDAEAAR